MLGSTPLGQTILGSGFGKVLPKISPPVSVVIFSYRTNVLFDTMTTRIDIDPASTRVDIDQPNTEVETDV